MATSTTTGRSIPTPCPAGSMKIGPTAGLSTSRARPGRPGRCERVGRGLAAGDLDNDGRVDAVIVAQNEPLAYFHNRTPERGPVRDVPARRDEVEPRWRRGQGHGHGRRPAAGCAAHAEAAATSRPTTRGSTSDSATATASTRVEVRWPSGQVDRWTSLAAGTGYRLREGHHAPLPLAGFAPLSDRRFFPARSLFCEWRWRGSGAYRIWPWRWRHFPEECLSWYPGA